jgi:hypothetical protein
MKVGNKCKSGRKRQNWIWLWSMFTTWKMNGEKHNKEYRWQMTIPKLEWSHNFESTAWKKQQKVDENMKTLQNKKDGQLWEHESCEKTKRRKEKWNDWNVKSMASNDKLKTFSRMMVSWEHPS